ncbi:hypothetical protein N7509_004015 [Penicillium cosmopolitanum]|uniref:AAA+ ATPase domain-containing protein n=1 Tax=Penicillium cosmopolitanum TaxID=1131564 RepID=A0A9X0BC14_9EURO|nr:uncharacterized protein N7509_004015 [Penicillium cosmopolitanum]KAJ5404144.1 hypothetical protein N7509_004015 [Penicillium cosmopolitanum]
MNELNPDIYTVAWIAPLEIEAQAALHMLDNHHRGRFALNRGDDYVFRAGDLGGHNTIIATLPAGQEYGTGSAAALASQVKKFFPNLWFGLLVGVAAGLPSLSRHPPRDIRLGDVLVGLPEGNSAGLIAYDLGKDTGAGGFQLLRDGHVLANTETVVRSAIQNIKLMAPQDVDTFKSYYETIRCKQHANGDFNDPGQDHDHLYQMDDKGVSHIVQRERRPDSARTRVWYGPIGSGEKLMKNTRRRNELRDKYSIIGLEMEAAGTMNRIPVGVIRGVCDYGDEHKNKGWQSYAAAMAAAYAKAILYEIRPKASAPAYVKRETDDQGIQSRLPVRTTFLGREEEMSQMKQCFGSDLCRKSLVLWGLSGSGKTQLAIHYVSTNKQTYKSVLWIDGSTSALIHQSFENLSHHISGYNRERPATEQVIEWLERETNRSWMIVFDGVPGAYDVDDPENFDIRKYLPTCDHGHILLVTTASDLHLRLALPEIHLEGVDDITGCSILLRCAGVQAPDDSGKATARSISHKLGGLPSLLNKLALCYPTVSFGWMISISSFNSAFLIRRSKLP